jgi:S1-C subfamily serine protease
LAGGVGLLVATVEVGSLAARAGIQAGDLIVRLGGGQLRSAAQLKRALLALDERGEFSLTILREGENDAIAVTVAPGHENVYEPDGSR